MGDNGELKGQEEKREMKLIITISEEKGTSVEGPGNGDMYNEPMCYWLLERAKDFIKARNANVAVQKNQKHITVPGSMHNFARRFKR